MPLLFDSWVSWVLEARISVAVGLLISGLLSVVLEIFILLALTKSNLVSRVCLLLLLVGNVRDGFKNRQSTDNVLIDQVKLVQKWVLGANQSLHQTVDVLFKYLLVADGLLQVSILLLDLHQVGKCLRVDKLASLAVWALEVVMILLA